MKIFGFIRPGSSGLTFPNVLPKTASSILKGLYVLYLWTETEKRAVLISIYSGSRGVFPAQSVTLRLENGHLSPVFIVVLDVHSQNSPSHRNWKLDCLSLIFIVVVEVVEVHHFQRSLSHRNWKLGCLSPILIMTFEVYCQFPLYIYIVKLGYSDLG